MANLEDRQAIAEQLGRYSQTFDAHDADGWAALFTEDGVFEVRVDGNPDPVFRAHGTQELRTFATNAPHLIHHIGGLVFDEIRPDSARTRATVLVTWTSPEDGNPGLYTHGVYEQHWSRSGETWRLARLVAISAGYNSAASRSIRAR